MATSDREQIPACREHLAELNEDRPQAFEREPQSYGRRRLEPASDRADTHKEPNTTVADAAQHHFVEAEAHDGVENLDETQ